MYMECAWVYVRKNQVTDWKRTDRDDRYSEGALTELAT